MTNKLINSYLFVYDKHTLCATFCQNMNMKQGFVRSIWLQKVTGCPKEDFKDMAGDEYEQLETDKKFLIIQLNKQQEIDLILLQPNENIFFDLIIEGTYPWDKIHYLTRKEFEDANGT